MNMKALKVCLLLLIFAAVPAAAQITKIMGTVTDARTKEPIPFVNILIRGTTLGVLTDFEGNFAIEFRAPADSIRASLIGYRPSTKRFQRNQFQNINFSLEPEQYDLPEVTITYSGNPAEVIMKKVAENKDKNSMQGFNSYQYEAYTKIELDANNITEQMKSRKLWKPFDFIFQYVDTSTINGKSYLPVFLTETMSDVYYRKNPRAKKEIIKASKISGFKNESLSQFLGNLSEQIDIYKDHIAVFEKNFVSPAASFGVDYYKYYLVDSAYIGDNWCYHIMFKPRRKQELTFTGNLWVADTSFAVRKVEMQIASDANINFINDLAIRQEYEWTDHKYWMLTRDQMVADFNIIENTDKVLGFYGYRTVSYRNFIFDPPEGKRFLSLPANVFIENGSNEKTDAYWEAERHEELSASERTIYNMVDSIKKVPVFRTYSDIVYTAVNGYLPWQDIELGPYSKLVSYNEVEGLRLRFGFRTSNKFSKKLQLEPYVAYGFNDHLFKFGAEAIYMFSKNPRRDLTVKYKSDVEQLGLSPTAFATDNILSSLFHRGPNDKLTNVRELKMCYEHEWFNGLINRIWFTHRELFPPGNTVFVTFPDGPGSPYVARTLYTSEIRLDTRLSFRERFVTGEFYRYTLSSYYPIILLSYAYGIPNFIGSDYGYHKLSLNIQQWFNFTTLGWSKYAIEAGKTWGTLPYPLLKIHDGNQTFLFDEFSANMMNYYEFLSDQYLSVYYTHHFDGLLFNHLPGIRKLKWREVAQVRCVYGTLTQANEEYSLFPGNLRSFAGKPYWEAGVGIENIFRIVRVDAIWRLNHLNDVPGMHTNSFGLFVSLFFQF
jgi:hypothetical protein